MDDDGWSFPARGNKPSAERKKLLLNPTAPSSRSMSAKPHSPHAMAKKTIRGVASPKIFQQKIAVPTSKAVAKRPPQPQPADNSTNCMGALSPQQIKQKNVSEYSISQASSEAFPALGAAVATRPPTGASAKARLQDVRAPVKRSGDSGGDSGGTTSTDHDVAPTAAAKRSKKVTLFDMIVKGTTGGSKTASRTAPKPPLKSTIEVVSAKHIARKKKKRSTKLKKKLLKERQKYYESLNPSPVVTTVVNPDSTAVADAPPGAPRLTTMALRNFLDESIEDEEELEEVLDSARDIVSSFGEVRAMEVRTITEEGSPERVLFIDFSSPEVAKRALLSMHNSIYGGTAVHAELVQSGQLLSSDKRGPRTAAAISEIPTPPGAVDSVLRSASSGDLAGKPVVLSGVNNDKRLAYDNHSTVYIQNFILPEDIEDEDEAEDVLNDMLLLCDKFSPTGLWIENADQDSFAPYAPTRAAPGVETPCPVGVLSFDTLDGAAACRDRISQSCGKSVFVANKHAVESGIVDTRSLFGASSSSQHEISSNLNSLVANNFFCIRISRFVTTEDITDDDERGEIVGEIRNLCSNKLQEYKGVDIEESDVVVDCVIFGDFSSCDRSSEDEKNEDELDVFVFVNMKNNALGDTLCLFNALSGVLVGGVPLVISVCCTFDKVLREMISAHNTGDTAGILSESMRQLDGCLADLKSEDLHELDHILPAETTLFLVVVLGLPWRLLNSTCTTEISDMSQAELLSHDLWRYEWKLELLRLSGFSDVSSLLTIVTDQKFPDFNTTTTLASDRDCVPTHFEHLRNVSVCGCIFPTNANRDGLKSTGSTTDNLSNPSLEVCVAFESRSRALAAMLYLEKLMIGGSELVVSIRIGSPIEDILAAEKYPQAKVPRSSFDNLVSGASTYGLSPTAEAFVPKMVSARNVLKVTPQVSPAEPEASPNLVQSITVVDVGTTVENGPPVIPRLPKKTTINYDIKHANDEINDTVKIFLSSLATFQKRVKETDPLNFNRKRRLLFGMKQARNSIKSGRAKAIFIAPDFEDSEALDEKLDEVIQEARAKEIPILCCLSRRKLAKATGNSMRQVVVAVLDADGAYDHYKTIMKYIASTE